MNLNKLPLLFFVLVATLYDFSNAKRFSDKLKQELRKANFLDNDTDLDRILTKLHRYREKAANKLRKEAGLKEIPPTPSSSTDEEVKFEDFLFQGDILLTENQIDNILLKSIDEEEEDGANIRARRAAPMNSGYWSTTLWQKKPSTIPYYIDSTLSGNAATAQLIRWAVNFWQYKTCLLFQEVSSLLIKNDPNIVYPDFLIEGL
jgi:hypothetical protein